MTTATWKTKYFEPKIISAVELIFLISSLYHFQVFFTIVGSCLEINVLHLSWFT